MNCQTPKSKDIRKRKRGKKQTFAFCNMSESFPMLVKPKYALKKWEKLLYSFYIYSSPHRHQSEIVYIRHIHDLVSSSLQPLTEREREERARCSQVIKESKKEEEEEGEKKCSRGWLAFLLFCRLLTRKITGMPRNSAIVYIDKNIEVKVVTLVGASQPIRSSQTTWYLSAVD